MFMNETVVHLLGENIHWQTLHMVLSVNCGMYADKLLWAV